MYIRGGNIGMKKKTIGIIIFILLVGSVSQVTGNVLDDNNPVSFDSDNILYVGGDGSGNYSKIQDAIDNAFDGDTVFVFDDSSPYVENLIVDKSITLFGENKDTTVIDGSNNKEGEGDVIHINADGVTVQGFTIKNCSTFGSQTNFFCGIEIWRLRSIVEKLREKN